MQYHCNIMCDGSDMFWLNWSELIWTAGSDIVSILIYIVCILIVQEREQKKMQSTKDFE